ncbi:uncharacterized protein K489DRAFT_378318 [Dissoconium aciculare CBS 342.82]|uniref:Uncharacterized protein n=1 Tax=Dissoconium aciculare CBS 342.82 TaxID=1314786 RepID=A0A6J3M7G3_9PEZI|nr:uncharacterized protein K489DRAFT_378318 [Dissoconium aciculare CBS 342.82]KAF1823945.1 hypothetical protein K489DRAFT_378318 [Dissoconium aciculare CBS 342.82]
MKPESLSIAALSRLCSPSLAVLTGETIILGSTVDPATITTTSMRTPATTTSSSSTYDQWGFATTGSTNSAQLFTIQTSPPDDPRTGTASTKITTTATSTGSSSVRTGTSDSSFGPGTTTTTTMGSEGTATVTGPVSMATGPAATSTAPVRQGGAVSVGRSSPRVIAAVAMVAGAVLGV